MEVLKSVKKVFLQSLFPPDGHCLLCRKILLFEDAPLCNLCIDKIHYIEEETCKKCGKEERNPSSGLCDDCTFGEHYFEQGLSLFLYDLIGKKLIQEIKYYGNIKMAHWIGRKISPKLNKMSWINEIDYILPVPLHPNRLKERGFNQAEEIVKGIRSSNKNLQYSPVLIRVKDTPHQTDLNKMQRQENIKDAFQVNDPSLIKNKNLLVIDDVYTTGSTLDACSKTLKEAGAKNVYFTTAASGESWGRHY